MYYVGIDIAKRSHVACVMREDNSLEIRPFEFYSIKSGFEKLRAQLSSLSCDISEVLIGMEKNRVKSLLFTVRVGITDSPHTPGFYLQHHYLTQATDFSSNTLTSIQTSRHSYRSH